MTSNKPLVINRAYKTKLNPTPKQIAMFERCCSAARVVFNWALADYHAEYVVYHKELTDIIGKLGVSSDSKLEWKQIEVLAKEAGLVFPAKPQPSGRNARKKKFNAIKGNDEKLSWITETPYTITEREFDNFDSAMKRFADAKKSGECRRVMAERFSGSRQEKWKRRYAKRIERGFVGDELLPIFPTFKSRFDDGKFSLSGAIRATKNEIRLPVIGTIRLAETGYIPVKPNKYISATISEKCGNWYISVDVEETIHLPEELKPVTLGVSVGVNDLVGTSAGYVAENPKLWKEYNAKKSRLQRELSRRSNRVVGADGAESRSKNWYKTKAKLAKLEMKIANVRNHNQHVASRQIVQTEPERIVIKAMKVKDMMQNEKIARYVGDAAMSEMTRKIKYKAQWRGIEITESTKEVSGICSDCGSKNTKTNFSNKVFTCCDCGMQKRISINTAENLVVV